MQGPAVACLGLTSGEEEKENAGIAATFSFHSYQILPSALFFQNDFNFPDSEPSCIRHGTDIRASLPRSQAPGPESLRVGKLLVRV